MGPSWGLMPLPLLLREISRPWGCCPVGTARPAASFLFPASVIRIPLCPGGIPGPGVVGMRGESARQIEPWDGWRLSMGVVYRR